MRFSGLDFFKINYFLFILSFARISISTNGINQSYDRDLSETSVKELRASYLQIYFGGILSLNRFTQTSTLAFEKAMEKNARETSKESFFVECIVTSQGSRQKRNIKHPRKKKKINHSQQVSKSQLNEFECSLENDVSLTVYFDIVWKTNTTTNLQNLKEVYDQWMLSIEGKNTTVRSMQKIGICANKAKGFRQVFGSSSPTTLTALNSTTISPNIPSPLHSLDTNFPSRNTDIPTLSIAIPSISPTEAPTNTPSNFPSSSNISMKMTFFPTSNPFIPHPSNTPTTNQPSPIPTFIITTAETASQSNTKFPTFFVTIKSEHSPGITENKYFFSREKKPRSGSPTLSASTSSWMSSTKSKPSSQSMYYTNSFVSAHDKKGFASFTSEPNSKFTETITSIPEPLFSTWSPTLSSKISSSSISKSSTIVPEDDLSFTPTAFQKPIDKRSLPTNDLYSLTFTDSNSPVTQSFSQTPTSSSVSNIPTTEVGTERKIPKHKIESLAPTTINSFSSTIEDENISGSSSSSPLLGSITTTIKK